MKPGLAAFLLALGGLASLAGDPAAAQPVREAKSLLLDLSSESLIDAESAKAVLKDNIPARVWKLYPEGRYTFLSQVAGGLTAEGFCVVTARVVLLPRTGTVRAVLWRPQQRTTVFDAKPGSNADQCKALAKDKLKEATTALVSTLVKS
jgi:hypothetical protein